ncbi:MAG: hypothetical protein IKA55_06180 [Akkermansia sp.]|nr:hypothetical protein [Akkermansia sp.]
METLRLIYQLSDLDFNELLRTALIFMVATTIINAFGRSKTLVFLTLITFILMLTTWKEGADYCSLVRRITLHFSMLFGFLLGYVTGDLFRRSPSHEEE